MSGVSSGDVSGIDGSVQLHKVRGGYLSARFRKGFLLGVSCG